MANKITVTILTKNSSKYLYECLSSVIQFDEVVILDNGSSDNTIEIAKSFSNVKIYKSTFIGFGPLKNLAASYASNDWIFSLDSDEILTPELTKEIINLKLYNNYIYSIKRDNYYKNKLIKCCGWNKDYVVRLFNKTYTKFNEKQVHESIVIDNLTIKTLKNSFSHYSYDNIKQLIDKMQLYSTLFAEDFYKERQSSPTKALLHAFVSFFKNFIIQKGFICGYEGLIISITNANYVFYKYIKLYEINQKEGES